MASPGSLSEFNPSGPEEWESWAECFQYFLTYHDITAEAKKKALFIISCGSTTLSVIHSLIVPMKKADVTSTQLIKALTDHLAPQPSRWVHHLELNRQTQRLEEIAAEFMVTLCQLTRCCMRSWMRCSSRDSSVASETRSYSARWSP